MKLKYLTQDALFTLSENQPIIYELMKNAESNEWLIDYIGRDGLVESKLNIEPLHFDTSFENPIDGDYVNAKILFEHLKDLNETQASDDRLWAGLAFTIGYDFLKYRWTLDSIVKVKYRWLFYTTNRRRLFYHGLSRLWWFVKMTYCPEALNPYELTEFVFKYPQIMKAITYRNYSNSDRLRKIIIKSFLKYVKQGGNLAVNKIDEIYKYISNLGSVSILDVMDEEYLETLIFYKLIKLESQIK